MPVTRNNALARIHILKAALGLDRETYEAVLWTVARKESAADLDEHQRGAVAKHLEATLRRTDPNHKALQARPRQRPAAGRSQLVAKIRALLMGATPRRDDAYADAIAKRMFGVDQFTWCEEEQLRKLVAALSIDQRRAAVKKA